MIYLTLLRHRELSVTPVIPRFSRASIPSQTAMYCNLTLTILSVGPNHLGSYLIKPSVTTTVSPAEKHLYSPPILSTRSLWNLAIHRKTSVCGCQATLHRTNNCLNSLRKPTNSSALCAELLGVSKAPKSVVHLIFLPSGDISATQPKYGLHSPLATKAS